MKKYSFFQQRKMPIDELSKYHRDVRKQNYDTGKKLSGIEFRKYNYWFVRFVLKIDQLMAKEKIVILADHSYSTKTPKIYTITHIGGNDIQRALQVIKNPAWLMLGDPGILYKDPIFYGLKLNGIIPLDNDYSEDRHIAYKRAVELLNCKGNLMIFPEAAQNISPNLLVMKIFNGAVRMAMETGSEIIPVAIEHIGDTYYCNIGENYKINNDSSITIKELTEELRSKMATLKWEIIDTYGKGNRSSIPSDYWEKFVDNIVNGNYESGITVKDIERERFHDKNIVEPKEAFAYLDILTPSLNNAFLYRK